MMSFLHKKYAFSAAIEALRQGKRIRRASEKKGYAKLSGCGSSFLTYWVDDDRTSAYCIFTIEDIFAEDWIIE